MMRQLEQGAKSLQRRVRKRFMRPFVSDMTWEMLVSGPQRVASFSERTTIYTALSVLEHRYGLRAGSLTAAELKVFSQNGEDGVIMELLSRLGVQQGHFIEFGIEDGREGNCVLLADVLGWSGLFVEADAKLFARLRAKYAFNDRVDTRCAMVTPENVNDLFRDQPVDTDILSIDIDGQDYWVWDAIDVIRPKIVIIEYNSLLGPDDDKVEPQGASPVYSTTFGASIGALRRLGRAKGYALVHLEMSGVNAFFVRDDLARPPAHVTFRGPNYFLSGVNYDNEGVAMVEAAQAPHRSRRAELNT